MPSSQPRLRWLGQLRRVVILLLGCLLLTGCVKSDIGITFDNPTHGTIVQHIQFGEQVTRLSAPTTQVLLDTLDQRVRQLGGTLRRRDRQSATVTIPFSTSQDLATKFNRFLNPDLTPSRGRKVSLALPKIDSRLKVEQGNFILLERRHVVYDIDLRSLGVSSPEGNTLLDPSSLLDLEFTLKAPWGARSTVNSLNAIRPTTRQRGKQLVWVLKPGQKNHLEASFWMPSPIGLGTLMITLIVGAGIYIKRNYSPTQTGPKPLVEV
jgi:Protein of unknown function (DUF3153)